MAGIADFDLYYEQTCSSPMSVVGGLDAGLGPADHGNPIMHLTTTLLMHRVPVRFGYLEHYFGLELPFGPPDVGSIPFLGPSDGIKSSTNVPPGSGASNG